VIAKAAPTRPQHALLTLAWATLFASACEPQLEPLEPVRIGVLNPLTGQLGSLGPSWENASRLAAEQVNSAGGLFEGRQLELAFYDTETTAAGAESAARTALDEGAVALVGPASSGESAATIDTVAGFEVPQVSCCATSPALTATGDWFFRTAPNDLLQAKAVAYIAAEGFDGEVVREPCSEAIVLARDDNYGQGLADVFVTEYAARPVAGTAANGRVVANIAYDSTAGDFDTEAATAVDAVMTAFNAAHDAAVDQVCVLLVSFAPDGAAMLRALDTQLTAAAGNPATFEASYLGTDGLFDAAFATGAQGVSLKMLGTAPTHASNSAYEKFENAHHARFGAFPGNLTSNMYDAVVMLALSITSKRSTAGDDIRDGLFEISKDGQRFDGAFFGDMAEALLAGNDIDYVGPSGELDFDDAGDVVGDFTLWQPAQVDASTFTIEERDFLPASVFAP
jgi:branched-chain amino acid transport system substrate-binding protein